MRKPSLTESSFSRASSAGTSPSLPNHGAPAAPRGTPQAARGPQAPQAWRQAGPTQTAASSRQLLLQPLGAVDQDGLREGRLHPRLRLLMHPDVVVPDVQRAPGPPQIRAVEALVPDRPHDAQKRLLVLFPSKAIFV